MLNLSPHHLKKKYHYDGLQEKNTDSGMILFGAPYDGTASFRKGAAKAPDAIRKVTLLSQETYSPYFEKDLMDLPIFDAGNLVFEDSQQDVIERTEGLVRDICKSGKIPFMLGGEHLLTLPSVRAVKKEYGDLHLLHLDAHTDFIDELFGKKESHGTVIRRIWDLLGDERIFGFGIRSGSKEDFSEYENHVYCHKFDLAGADEVIKMIEKKPVYLSVDIDVFDPSLISGTGTPEAGGISFSSFIQFLREIRHLNIVGMDLMELAPEIDPSGNSAIIAGQISREMMCALFPSV